MVAGTTLPQKPNLRWYEVPSEERTSCLSSLEMSWLVCNCSFTYLVVGVVCLAAVRGCRRWWWRQLAAATFFFCPNNLLPRLNSVLSVTMYFCCCFKFRTLAGSICELLRVCSVCDATQVTLHCSIFFSVWCGCPKKCKGHAKISSYLLLNPPFCV
jgi:hypothetical protein